MRRIIICENASIDTRAEVKLLKFERSIEFIALGVVNKRTGPKLDLADGLNHVVKELFVFEVLETKSEMLSVAYVNRECDNVVIVADSELIYDGLSKINRWDEWNFANIKKHISLSLCLLRVAPFKIASNSDVVIVSWHIQFVFLFWKLLTSTVVVVLSDSIRQVCLLAWI